MKMVLTRTKFHRDCSLGELVAGPLVLSTREMPTASRKVPGPKAHPPGDYEVSCSEGVLSFESRTRNGVFSFRPGIQTIVVGRSCLERTPVEAEAAVFDLYNLVNDYIQTGDHVVLEIREMWHGR